MIPTRALLNSAKHAKKSGSGVPVEVYPLFVACGFVVVAASYSFYRKLAFGDLRLSRTGKAGHEEGEAESH